MKIGNKELKFKAPEDVTVRENAEIMDIVYTSSDKPTTMSLNIGLLLADNPTKEIIEKLSMKELQEFVWLFPQEIEKYMWEESKKKSKK